MATERATEWAACLQGFGDLWSHADAAALDLSAAGTVEAWVYVFEKDLANYPAILVKGDINSAYQMQIDNDYTPKRMNFRIHNGASNYTATDPGDLPRSAWVHYVGRWNSTNVQIVKNATQVASAAAAVTCDTNNNPLRIGDGQTQTANRYFGLIADVRLWNIYRNDAAIASTMSTPLVGNESGLVANWKFDEGIGDTAFDSGPNGLHLQLTNSHQWSSGRGRPY